MKIYSLGYNCEVEMNLRKYYQRNKLDYQISTPLNWNISDLVLPILQQVKRGGQFFEFTTIVEIKHDNGTIGRLPKCVTTGLLSSHDLPYKTINECLSIEQTNFLMSKYAHTSGHLREIVFEQKGNTFLRRIADSYQDWKYIKENIKEQDRITAMLAEKEDLIQFMKEHGHQIYFLSTQRDLCDESTVFYMQYKIMDRIYPEYRRVIRKIQ